MRIKPSLLVLFALCACSSGQAEQRKPAKPNQAEKLTVITLGVKADRILVDKSDRILILYKGTKEIARYAKIRLGDAPVGHKQFEGDEKTPEGTYVISGRNPGSSYHRSLKVSYPNAADIAYAKSKGRPAGGDIFIHGQPNGAPGGTIDRDWTDGCIAMSNAQIEQLWDVVPDGAKITIRP